MNWNGLELPDKNIYFQDDDVIIYNADCRDLLPLIPNKSIDLVLTDPPYGIGVNYGVYADNKLTYWDWFLPILAMMRDVARKIVFTHNVQSLLHINGWDYIGVWQKPFYRGSRLGNSCIIPSWEPIYLFGIHTMGVKTKGRYDVFSFHVEKTGLHPDSIGRRAWKELDTDLHPCPKPVGLFQELLQTFSQDTQEIILDPFLGSGTTAYCAKKLGRKCIGIEISEEYCAIAAKRCSQAVMALPIEPNPKEVKSSEIFFPLLDGIEGKELRGLIENEHH